MWRQSACKTVGLKTDLVKAQVLKLPKNCSNFLHLEECILVRKAWHLVEEQSGSRQVPSAIIAAIADLNSVFPFAPSFAAPRPRLAVEPSFSSGLDY